MKKTYLFTLLMCLVLQLFAQKTVFRPIEWNNPNHEYHNRLSDDRMYESENFVLFWGDLVGTNPQTASDASLRFNPQSVADTLETSFSRMIDDLHFINNDPSTNFGRYKNIVMILGTFSGGDDRTTGFAHASSYSNTIGALFVHPAAVRDGGALSHEYAHCLQMMMRIQENPGNGNAFAGYDWAGPLFEGHANYMRAIVYPHWADTDGTLTRWLQTRHFMWSSNRHHYTNYHLLFYVQEKDGFEMTRRMWAESTNREHPLETIKRLKGFTQEGLNNYLWEYAAKQVAFDYPIQWNDQINQNNNFGKTIRNVYQGIKTRMPRYLSRQHTLLTRIEGSTDRYYTNDDWAPQDYGMNIIPLHPTCEGVEKKVSIKFKGHTEVNPEQAGWRYGFVTTKSDGTVSRYSPMYSEEEGEASFTLNTATESEIFFVVFSAPKTHINYNMDVGYPKQRRYPYEVKIANANPEGYQAPAQFRTYLKTNGRIHANGGGWVSNTANVAASVYVGPYAIVRRGTISGNARIEDHAMVDGGTINGNAIVRGNACVYNATISDNAIVEGNGWMEGGTARNSALIQGNAFLFAGNYSGSIIIGGDAEIGNCDNGVYMQFPYWRNGRTACDGKGASDASNIDINGTFNLFSNAQMEFNTTPTCTDVVIPTYTLSSSITGSGSVNPASGTYNEGSNQQLTAIPDNGYLFSHWSGDAAGNENPLTITMNSNKSVIAHFIEIPIETIVHTITMEPKADYSAIQVELNTALISATFGLNPDQIASAFGTDITYYAINPNGSLNANSTANAPGHWFNQNGETTAWGANAYIYSELNITSLTANIGQYPDRSIHGDSYTIRQALVYDKNASEKAQVNLVFHITIEELITETTKIDKTDKLSTFPNPTEDIITLSRSATWKLVDVNGKELQNGSGTVVDLSMYAKGIYYIQADEQSIKIIKK